MPSNSQLSASGLPGILGIKHLRHGDFNIEKLNVYTCPSNLLIAPVTKNFLKLKDLALIIYWILSLMPIIFSYLIIFLNINYFEYTDGQLKNFLINFSILINWVSLFFWVVLVPIDIRYKKVSSNFKFQIFYGYFLKLISVGLEKIEND